MPRLLNRQSYAPASVSLQGSKMRTSKKPSGGTTTSTILDRLRQDNQDGDGITPLPESDQENYHYRLGEASRWQGKDQWRADDTLSTWNIFSFPPHIHHKQGGTMPLRGKPASFGARKLKALTYVARTPLSWSGVRHTSNRLWPTYLSPTDGGALLRFLIQHNSAFTLTKPSTSHTA